MKNRPTTPKYLIFCLGIGIGIFIVVIMLGIIDYLARMGKL